MSVAGFYDDLAATYHALYPDWAGAGRRQALALARLLDLPPDGAADVADVACGIGTQTLGLAALGYRVRASDVSPGAVRRARDECARRGVAVAFAVADMRDVPWPDGSVDAVVCADNALPHLLEDADVVAALAQMRRVLRPGGRVAVTTRDYDDVLERRPSGTPPHVFRADDGRRVVSFQLWHWRPGLDVYDLEHFQVVERADGAWDTARRATSYRAYRRDHLLALAADAGLTDATWRMPADGGYFQPVLIARR